MFVVYFYGEDVYHRVVILGYIKRADDIYTYLDKIESKYNVSFKEYVRYKYRDYIVFDVINKDAHLVVEPINLLD